MLFGALSARLREWRLVARSWFELACDDLRLVGLKLVFLIVTRAVSVLASRGDSHQPHRALNQAAPLRPLPDRVTDLDHFQLRRYDRAGGVIHEYRLVA
jgi:hypothetical protein